MKKTFAFLFAMSMIAQVFSQKEKFDIATFIPPIGWQRIDTNGTVAFFESKTVNGLTRFCQIILYPSGNSQDNANKNFNAAWQNLVAIPTKSKAKPVIETGKTPDGWTVVTGAANVTFQGLNYNSMVSSITGFGKTMNVQVNTTGGDYQATLERFFNDLDLDNKATISNNQTTVNGIIKLNDYDFILPDKWQLQKNKDHLLIQNMQSGCTIRILEPQPSSGNLEQDVNAVFDMMYQGWQFQKNGAQKYDLAKGFLPKGLEYFMKAAAMTGTSADGRYNLEEGSAIVVKADNQIVIISVRHNSSAMGHDDCYKNYNTWRRFLNSFTVKNVLPVKSDEEDIAKRIVGWWKIDATGVVSADYVFAANGNYKYGGAIGSSTTTSDMYYKYIYNRAYPFEGDGAYSITGNQISLKQRGVNSPALVKFRFEKVSHGGAGWKDRIYLLKKDAYGENESLYEKQEK